MLVLLQRVPAQRAPVGQQKQDSSFSLQRLRPLVLHPPFLQTVGGQRAVKAFTQGSQSEQGSFANTPQGRKFGPTLGLKNQKNNDTLLFQNFIVTY